MTHTIDAADVKSAARGCWPEILSSVLNLPIELFDGNLHDCPKCGAADAFRLISAETGACECRGCAPQQLPR